MRQPVLVLLAVHALLIGAVPNCFGVDAPDPSAGGDSVRAFTDRSNQLNLNPRPAVELNALLIEYEELIGRSKGVAGVEWAMWDLARLYSTKNDSNANPVADSLDRSIAWYRRAASTARPGSGLWRECQFGLISQLHRTHDVSVLPATRQIIEDLGRRFPEQPAVQLRCKQHLVFQLIAENQLDDAEKFVIEILKTGSFDPPELLRTCKTTTINAFLQGALAQQGADGVSDERLQRLLDAAPDDADLQRAVEMVRGMRPGWTAFRVDPVKSGDPTRLPGAFDTTGGGSGRSFILINLICLGAFIAVRVGWHLSRRRSG